MTLRVILESSAEVGFWSSVASKVYKKIDVQMSLIIFGCFHVENKIQQGMSLNGLLVVIMPSDLDYFLYTLIIAKTSCESRKTVARYLKENFIVLPP